MIVQQWRAIALAAAMSLAAMGLMACQEEQEPATPTAAAPAAPAGATESAAVMPAATTAVTTSAMTTTGSAEEVGTATFIAKDYGYDGPDSVPSGVVHLVMQNNGGEPHQITLLKLSEGKTMADLQTALKAAQDAPPPTWITSMGGPNAVLRPDSSDATLFLDPGNYVMLCFIPGADGIPHFAKGMIKALTVAPATGEKASAPKSDLSVDTKEFTYTLSADVTAGKHIFKVDNTGKQDHEVTVVQLDAGKTVTDLLAAFAPGAPPGPPPAKFLGGLTSIGAGQQAYFSAEFQPGNSYSFVCFVTDPATGKEHAMLGMSKTFDVK